MPTQCEYIDPQTGAACGDPFEMVHVVKRPAIRASSGLEMRPRPWYTLYLCRRHASGYDLTRTRRARERAIESADRLL